MKRKSFKIFRKQLGDQHEVYFVFYAGLMCSGIVIFQEVEEQENGMVFVKAKKIDCSYAEVVKKLKQLSIACVKEDKFVFEDVEYKGYKSAFHNYRKIGTVITASGYRVLDYGSAPRVYSIVETYMPKKGFYHVVKNSETPVPSDCVRDERFYKFFIPYAKKSGEFSKFELEGKEYDFCWMEFNQNNFCGVLYLDGAFQKYLSYSECLMR